MASFLEYLQTQLFYLRREPDGGDGTCWVLWSRKDGGPGIPQHHYGTEWDFIYWTSRFSPIFNRRIRAALMDFVRCYINGVRLYLVQFWAKEERRSSLTTQHLPFTLSYETGNLEKMIEFQGLCDYRMICSEHIYFLDDEHLVEGIPGRVFRTGTPEYAPNVANYAPAEHPLRQRALDCRVTSSVAYPVFEPLGQNCVGVVEIVSTSTQGSYDFADMLPPILQDVGLTCPVNYRHI